MAIYDILKYLSKSHVAVLVALKQCCKALHKHRSSIHSFVPLDTAFVQLLCNEKRSCDYVRLVFRSHI